MAAPDEKTLSQIVNGLANDLKYLRGQVAELGQPSTDVERLKRFATSTTGRLDRLTANLTDVASRVDSLKDAVGDEFEGLRKVTASLGESIAKLAADREDQPEAISWFALRGSGDGTFALEVLTDLVDWLAKVYRNYPDGVLPACWVRHAWVVEELLALRASHSAAFAKKAKPGLRIEWHEKRSSIAERIAKELKTPHGVEHHDDTLPLEVPLAFAIDHIAPAWALDGPDVPLPAPTRFELEAAAEFGTAKTARAKFKV